jgi:hypothetical protein
MFMDSSRVPEGDQHVPCFEGRPDLVWGFNQASFPWRLGRRPSSGHFQGLGRGLSLDLRHATVDRDFGAGNEAALVTGKEESSSGDLLGAGEASERNQAGQRFAHLVG